MFASGREFSAFLGLVPRQNSSGGKTRLGRVSKMGDRYLRTLLVAGATALLSHSKTRRSSLDLWAKALLEKKKPPKLVALALANKMARVAWAPWFEAKPSRVPNQLEIRRRRQPIGEDYEVMRSNSGPKIGTLR
jgi:transposase